MHIQQYVSSCVVYPQHFVQSYILYFFFFQAYYVFVKYGGKTTKILNRRTTSVPSATYLSDLGEDGWDFSDTDSILDPEYLSELPDILDF